MCITLPTDLYHLNTLQFPQLFLIFPFMTTSPLSLLPEYSEKAYRQDYSSQPEIEGVKHLDIRNFLNEEGDFSELFRFDESGHLEIMPDFQLRQVNRTTIFPQAIKAWHFHHKQDEIWYVPPCYQLTLGLWDLREDSPTKNMKKKIQLGGGASKAVFIPRGVGHGVANFSAHNGQLFYFVSQQFNANEPDEMRLHWNEAGAEFWTPERD